jgi:NAD(P)-dependent dehydrogenase (short-subunit alcohol dehydrogenase family)
MTLAGRTALVTGASSGLGRGLAHRLAEAGAQVVVTARRRERLDELVGEIKANGGEALAVEADVKDEAALKAVFDAAEARFGLVDTVYANAGMSNEGRSVEIPIEAFDEVMNVNTRAVFLTAREAAKRLIAAGPEASARGRIVLVASIGGVIKTIPGNVAYCVSKAAVAAMGKSLAREWARFGVAVNVICPGYVETDLNTELLQSEIGSKMIAGFPRRRVMAAEELDPMFLLLGSDAARGMTGGVHVVDDGQSL